MADGKWYTVDLLVDMGFGVGVGGMVHTKVIYD
jgi:hypothetical protein